MHFDDRLATVLRHRAAGERAARTQFRQLLDLLGERPQAGNPSLKAAAYLRLIALAEMIPAKVRAEIVGETGWRFRNPELVRWFGEAAPAVAAAALYRAHLSGAEWEKLIPQLPIRARGFLRHRRDLPEAAVRVLDRLGVQDRALPLPEPLELVDFAEELEVVDAPEAPADDRNALPQGDGIRAIVARIEAFKRARQIGHGEADAPRLPLGEAPMQVDRKPVTAFSFTSDSDGKIDWAEPEIAPMVIGTDLLARPDRGSMPEAFEAGPNLRTAFVNRQPVRGSRIMLAGAEPISGDWVVDAAPRFTRADGRFYGFGGRFSRVAAEPGFATHREADRLRQLLHELRTPVNAIQGFAEVIQQQLFGSTPHEYRALAAAIAGDAAHMLAGFEELDRLARLESGALDLEAGASDFAAIAHHQIAQLQSVLSPRVARLVLEGEEREAPIGLDKNEAEMLAWRLLATIAAATGAGEQVTLRLSKEDEQVELAAQLPTALRAIEDIFAADTRVGGGALSAGVFGAGFSLRLARAEARAAGGELVRIDDLLVLSLPLLTPAEALPSPVNAPGRAAG